MKVDLSGKIAVVLGAGSLGPGVGIGRAVSLGFASSGAQVVAVDRAEDAARETAAMIADRGGRAEPHGLDVTDDRALGDFLAAIIARLGHVDILYFNVGLGKAAPSDQTSPDEFRRFADANLIALHVASGAVLPSMRARRQGVIINTSSLGATRDLGYPHLAYAATKAAALQFIRMTATENAAFGVRANSIVAGLIDTPRIRVTLAGSYQGAGGEMLSRRAAQAPMQRMGTAADVANAALFLASDAASYITGSEIYVDGGLSATVRGPG